MRRLKVTLCPLLVYGELMTNPYPHILFNQTPEKLPSVPAARPSPVNRRVGIHNFTFEACSSFTRVTACKVAAHPTADSFPEASIRLVAQPNRSVATMSYRQLHGWILLPLTICAF